jgi:Ras-related protein Rap-1B
VLTVSCTGFSLFDGYLPHPSELDQYVASKSESVDEDPEETPVVACFSGPREMKIVVLGAPGVGKSGSVVQFIMNVFVEDYDPTIEDSYRKQFSFDDQTAMLEILDTAGTDQYAAMSELYMKNGEGFYLVYSLSDSSSFDKLRELRNKIVDVKCDNNVPMVVVANKADLEEKDIVVPASKGEALAEEWNVPFFVTSAKTRQNIEEAFRALVRKIHEKQ